MDIPEFRLPDPHEDEHSDSMLVQESAERISLRRAFWNLRVTAYTGKESMRDSWARFAEAYMHEGNAEEKKNTIREMVSLVPGLLLEAIDYHGTHGTIRRDQGYEEVLRAMKAHEKKHPQSEDVLQKINIHLGSELRGTAGDHASDQAMREAESLLQSGLRHFLRRFEEYPSPGMAMQLSIALYNLSSIFYNRGLAWQESGDQEKAEEAFSQCSECLEQSRIWDTITGNRAKKIQSGTRETALEFEQGKMSASDAWRAFSENRVTLERLGGGAKGISRFQSEGLWYLNAAGRELEALIAMGMEFVAESLLTHIAEHPMCEDWCGGKEAIEELLGKWREEIRKMQNPS